MEQPECDGGVDPGAIGDLGWQNGAKRRLIPRSQKLEVKKDCRGRLHEPVSFA